MLRKVFSRNMPTANSWKVAWLLAKSYCCQLVNTETAWTFTYLNSWKGKGDISGHITSQSLLFEVSTVLRHIAVNTMCHATQHTGGIPTYLRVALRKFKILYIYIWMYITRLKVRAYTVHRYIPLGPSS